MGRKGGAFGIYQFNLTTTSCSPHITYSTEIFYDAIKDRIIWDGWDDSGDKFHLETFRECVEDTRDIEPLLRAELMEAIQYFEELKEFHQNLKF